MLKPHFIALCLFVGLTGCKSTEVSETITQNTIKEVTEVKRVVKQIKDKTPIECKSDLLIAQLQTIETQTDSIKAQVENISSACQVEKAVLKRDIKIRELIIIGFFVFFLFVLIIRLKGGK